MLESERDFPNNDRPRIVHIISGLGVGGAERTLQRLVTDLDSRGFESVIISLSSLGEIGRQLQQHGFQVFSLHWKPGRFSPISLFRFIRLVARLRPALIQTWMYHADLLGALISYWFRSIGLVWNIRGSLHELSDLSFSTQIVVRACRLLSSKPTAVIVNSEQGLQDHQALGYRPKEWVVIHNGIDTQRFVPSSSRRTAFRENLGVQPHDRLIGCVARFHPKKGHRFLIRSFAGLGDLSDRFYLVLVGPGINQSNAELVSWIQQEGVEGRVFLLGRSDDCLEIYPGMDMLAMPSQYGEGFPNVVAEAMSCGVPCVVTNVGDAALIVGDTGEVADADDVGGFRDAIMRLENRLSVNQEKTAEMARDRIQKRFNINQMLTQYEQLYKRFISTSDA